jgi:hypothetical protein
MNEGRYTAVPRNEDEKFNDLSKRSIRQTGGSIKLVLGLLSLVILSFGLGFGVGWEWSTSGTTSRSEPQVVTSKTGLLPPQSFFPDSKYLS